MALSVLTLLPGLARVLAWVESPKIRHPASMATAPCICVVLVPPHREKEGRVKKRKKREKEGRREGVRDSDSETVGSDLTHLMMDKTRVNPDVQYAISSGWKRSQSQQVQRGGCPADTIGCIKRVF